MASEPPLRLESLAALQRWRAARHEPVHCVPTMGNLHAGHARLIKQAGAHAGAVIATIYVNPTQFGPSEDYQRYPRTLDRDLEMLADLGCDAVWLPDDAAMYPLARQGFEVKPPGALADCLCGAHRPGHFDGVCNAVMRLLWQIRPDRAFFGEKDYQQLLIVRRMVRDFSIPVEIEAVPTVREHDGLALSSRNQYLSQTERRIAPVLYQCLSEAAAGVGLADSGTFAERSRSVSMRLENVGFEPEYVEFRDAETLDVPGSGPVRLFAAARLGRARLIDNVAVARQ